MQKKKSLEVTFGFLDLPEMQAQKPLTLDLTKDGHLAVFRVLGMGSLPFYKVWPWISQDSTVRRESISI